MLLTTSPCLSPLLLLSYVAEMPAGEAIQAHHRPTLLASAAPTHDATDAPCSRRYRCPRMGQNDDFIETLFFRWGVANNRVRYLFFVCGGWSRHFKKPGLKKMPPKNQLPLPRPPATPPPAGSSAVGGCARVVPFPPPASLGRLDADSTGVGKTI